MIIWFGLIAGLAMSVFSWWSGAYVGVWFAGIGVGWTLAFATMHPWVAKMEWKQDAS